MADPQIDLEAIIRDDGRYPIDAFKFLHDGLDRAVRRRHGQTTPGKGHHVTGEEICLALRDLAIKRWGLLAPTVLTKWNIHATIDFGEMVYLMIDRGVWNKTPEDSVEDFRDIYDFHTAFGGAADFELKE